jgi:SAM-dependent methyltransferase
VRQDERGRFHRALQQSRLAAYSPGEFVGQESFMRAGEIRQLARCAGIRPDTSVLDLCCGVAGPGRLIVAEQGCHYLGVDYSASALQLAGELAGGLACRFEQRRVPPLPDGRFDVVLLFETMLAFPDKTALFGEIAGALEAGGRFAFTVEEGRPLAPSERAQMPDAETVLLINMAELIAALSRVGLSVIWQDDCSASHHAVAAALLKSFRADSANIARQIGRRALAELIAAHQLWCEWLGAGRVRKFAVVAEKR